MRTKSRRRPARRRRHVDPADIVGRANGNGPANAVAAGTAQQALWPQPARMLLLLGVIAIIAIGSTCLPISPAENAARRISRSGPEMWGADRHAQSERREGRVRIRKKRRKHPDFRPRNPTLGETGGLPLRSALTNPRSPPPKAMEASQSITRRSASNLALAFVLLPRAKRQGMSALYAFCPRSG